MAVTTSAPTTDQEDLKNSAVYPSRPGALFEGMLNIVFMISSAKTFWSNKAALSARIIGERSCCRQVTGSTVNTMLNELNSFYRTPLQNS
jgi:hypothetical protein